MAYVGGDITEVRYNHPTIGTGVLFPKAGEDNTYDIGGFRKGDDTDAITASGEPIWKMNRVRGMFGFVIGNDMNTRKENEKLVALANSPVEAQWTFSIVNGQVYSGSGSIVGDIQPNINTATIEVKIQGGNFKSLN